MNTITALPTKYAGCHFRSRTEARWAVFFDTLGVAWQYEPQGFDLDGHRYLPDFWLPSLNAWYEVKGRPPTEHEIHLARLLEQGTGCDVYIAWGDIPREPWENGKTNRGPYQYPWKLPSGICIPCDYEQAWCVCPQCGKFGIEFEARGERVCRLSGDKGRNGNDRRLLAAYEVARSARFEHGQSG